MKKILLVLPIAILMASPAFGATKLSQINNGGALVPSTDQVVGVRSGTTDELLTMPAQLTAPNSTLTFGGTASVPTVDISTQSANTLLGSLTSTFPTGLAVPSCVAAGKALNWTSGTGFTCNSSIAAATVPQTGITGSFAQGDIMYYNGANWVDLAAGTNGFYLKTQGAAANPVWASVSATVAPIITAMTSETQLSIGGL